MLKQCAAAVVLAIVMSWAVAAQDPATVISNASKAMGADSLKTVEYTATGMDFGLGQAQSPNVAWPGFPNKSYTRQINFEVPASKVDRVRNQPPGPQRGGTQQPVIGDQAVNQTIIVNAQTPWAQQLEIVMTPQGFLKAASTNNATLAQQKLNGKTYNVLTFTGQNKAKVNGYINDQNMVEKVETWIDNAMLGDMLFEAIYTDYKDFGGVKFPTHIVQRQGGYPIFDLTVNGVKPNAPVNIQAPAGRGAAPAAAAAAPPAGGTPGAPSQKLADGVYLILGGYAAVAVDFKDYIMVIEGPQSEARATAIITEAKRLIPNKPIRYVVNTHPHFDHASGIRTFIAEGATVITQEINKAYWEKIATLPHTLNPDNLEKSKAKLTVETVGEKKVYTDGTHVVELHHDKGDLHQDGLLVAYFPKEKILVEADGFNPPASPDAPAPTVINQYTTSLYATINRLKLDVEQIVPVHYPADGRKVTKAELLKAIGQAAGPGAN